MRILIAVLTLTLLSNIAYSEARFESKKLADNIYTVYGVDGFTVGNHLLINGKDGLILVDSSMPDFITKLEDTLEKLTDEDDVDYLINTHLHADHIANNGYFSKEGATIVAHQGTYDSLKNKGLVSGAGVTEASEDMYPHVTFEQNLNLYLNDVAIKLMHLPDAHTNSDIIVQLPDLNIVHAGDLLFNGIFPFIDLNNGGTVDGYIKAQKTVLDMINSDTKLVAGHGAYASKSDLQKAHDMLVDSRSIVSKLKESGKSEDEVVKLNPLQKYHDDWNWGFITTEKMTRQVYRGI
ncbi:MBL fold metallo-hydrolase [Bermanella sp. R86510]|uniref:MBL fold metallo-hydrolase n=1 Tax=unclassified Bermanella TaxID=2627862 RepID=UPI0037C994B3